MGIQEVHPGLVGRIAIGDKAQGAILGQGPRGFPQGHGGGQGVAFGSHVVRGDLMPLRIEEEEGEVMFAGHTDIGFGAGSLGIPTAPSSI